MAYSAVTLPLTGTGDATAAPAVDLIGGRAYQAVKLIDGLEGSTLAFIAKQTTPDAADIGMVMRNIASSAFNQAVVGAVGITSGSSAVELTSAGSTRLVGQFTLANPTTAVTVSNPTTAVTITNPTTAVTISNPTTALDANLSSVGSTKLVGQVTVANPTTAVNVANPTTSITLSSQHTVTADLSSVGSTKLIGQVTVGNPTTAVTVSSGVILGGGSTANALGSVALLAGSTGNVVGAVAVTSGLVLGAGSSANTLGAVAVVPGTTGITLGSVALLGGSSANMLGTVVLSSATTGITVGSVALLSGTTANTVGSAALLAGGNTIGSVQPGLGSSANYWFQQSIPFSSGNVSRTTVNTTVDVSIIAANASRKAMTIANLSTVQTVALGLTTAITTTALANVHVFLAPITQVTFGMNKDFPLYLGPVRGINISSTTVAGGVSVLEFS